MSDAPQEEKIQRLLHELAEDRQDTPDDRPLTVDELRYIMAELSVLPTAVPSEAMTQALIENLRPHVPEPRFRSAMEAERASAARRLVSLVAAILPQANALGRNFWLATAILYAAVGVAGWLYAAPGTSFSVGPFIMFALPLLAIAGVGFAFRGTQSGFWEAERAAPIDPATLAIARFTLVTAHAIALATAITLGLGLFRIELHLGAFILSWLAPLLLLASLTLFLSVRWNGMIGSLAGFSLWSVFLLMHSRQARFDLLALPGEDFWLAGKIILFALTVLLWLVGVPWMRRGLATWRLEVG